MILGNILIVENNNLKTDEIKKILYFKVTDIWKRFCEKHSLLFEMTCDEYTLLLKSEIEKLEDNVSSKEKLISEINGLDRLREEIITEINQKLKGQQSFKEIKTVGDLLSVFKEMEKKNGQDHLMKFNKVLIDLIERIRSQNKKNQLFINKAIDSLRELREDVVGLKSYSTYSAKGKAYVRSL